MLAEKFLKHVGDLEEWNEDAGFEWGKPTAIGTNLVVVIHPHTYPHWKWNQATGTHYEHGRVEATAVAVYQPDGTEVALWVLDGDGSGPRVDTNYWMPPHARAKWEAARNLGAAIEEKKG